MSAAQRRNRRGPRAQGDDALAEAMERIADRLDDVGDVLDGLQGGGNGGNGGTNGAKAAQKLLDTTAKIILGIVVPSLLAVGAVLWSMHGRLSAIEGNRFTAEHGQAMESRLQEEIRRLPPQWLTDRLQRLEDRIDQYHGGGDQ